MNHEVKKGFANLKRPLVFAHRGASGEAPENTLPAFALAVEQRADVLEMDVHMTRDGVVVVCHDDNVARTTNGSGLVAEMTLEELQNLDAGYRFTADGGKSFPFRGKGVRIPTLREVLEMFAGVPLNIEVKANNRWLVNMTLALLGEFGRLDDGTVTLAAFDHDLIELIRHDAPALVATAFSVAETRRFITRLWVPKLQWHSCGYAFQVALRKRGFRIVTPRFVQKAHEAGYEVHPWTVDDERTMHRLLGMGVDGIFTNFPGRLRRVIADRQK